MSMNVFVDEGRQASRSLKSKLASEHPSEYACVYMYACMCTGMCYAVFEGMMICEAWVQASLSPGVESSV